MRPSRFKNFIFFFLCSIWLQSPGLVANESGGDQCFSCLIKVDDLSDPFPLKGQWKFTRDDKPENALPTTSTENWQTIMAPGSWVTSYGGDVFRVGWYRGEFEFADHLIGKKVTILFDAYMSQVHAFVDGREVFSRRGKNAYEKYYSIQPIPVSFKVTKKRHSLAIRIDTILMTGIYQMPFEMLSYDKSDTRVALYHFWGGEVRFISVFIILFFGLFFLLIFIKTKATIYLIAGCTGVFIFPFYGLPSDLLMRFFEPEELQLLHYTAIGSLAAFHGFYAQFFYKFYPKWNRFNVLTNIFYVGVFVGLIFHFDLVVFQIFRKVLFLHSSIVAVHFVYILARAALKGGKVIPLLVGEVIMWLCSIHDMFLALGYIQSVSLLFFGTVAATISILFVSSTIFANTYVQNKNLIKQVEKVNKNLEGIVEDRTKKLQEKSQDVLSMMEALPQGVMMIKDNYAIHLEYSRQVESIVETKDIAEQSIIRLVFENTDLTLDQLDQLKEALGCCFGNYDFNFEANAAMLPHEVEYTVGKKTKVLAMVWAPIVDEDDVIDKILLCIRDITTIKALEDEAAKQQKEMTMIGQILNIDEDKFWRFCKSTLQHIDDSLHVLERGIDDNTIPDLYWHMHTVKGNSRTLELSYITDLSHQIESGFANQQKSGVPLKQAIFITDINRLREEVQEYTFIAKDKLRMHEKSSQLADSPVIHQVFEALSLTGSESPDLLLQKVIDARKVLETNFHVSVDEALADAIASLTSISKDLGKEIPRVDLQGGDNYFTHHNAELISDVMGHLFKNAMDHGLETPDERIASGKNPKGTLHISIRKQDDFLFFTFGDDGRGINLEKLKAKGIANGLIPESGTSAQEIAELIFSSGLTTKENISHISGRGVGLDAVKGFLENSGGGIEIQLTESHGTDETFQTFFFNAWLPLDAEEETYQAS